MIRQATDADWPAIWPIWRAVVATGETYVWPPDSTESSAREWWMLPPPAEVWVVDDDVAGVVATAVVKPNQVGRGSHVANASFMVDPAHAGRGLGRTLGEAIISRARELGYEAMQFNAVVSTNGPAVKLWRSLGFDVVGTVPGGFQHSSRGRVDLLIMFRHL